LKNPERELAELAGEVRERLEEEARRGKRQVQAPGLRAAMEGRSLPATKAQAAPTPKAATKTTEPSKPAPKAPASRETKKLPRIPIETDLVGYDDRMQKLSVLAQEASGCRKCGLCETRTQVVFARGQARNRVMFIGEAPGADEDRQGAPFVGRAGKLLDQIIDATGFQRDEIYVANILKCRPPNNRDPLPEEIESCTPYLQQQIELVQPKIICALGRFAAQFLTGQPKATMGALRGKIHYYKDSIMVLPTYHPAALLRNPNFKRVVWEDVQLLRKEYLR
jgi:DNA polymerase